ncbi:hypothetical protein WEH80_13570 [Actinomycetes bacterium KLBMP 9759]
MAAAAGLWTLRTAVFPENLASIRMHQCAAYRTFGLRERIGRRHGAGATPCSSSGCAPPTPTDQGESDDSEARKYR